MSSTPDKPPTREERKKCWKLRDEYFACLDKLNILDPVLVEKQPDRATSCLDKKKHYEDACMASWVEYFNKRRVLDERQKQYLKFSEEQSGKK
ncbi:cytochrome c oxidase, subunit VIb [Halteromyces radiatus]|uniref:cytochrome c oxidase, subunit VIb n=1 Tax=Halteromyces radiatus TaxID=101107 RepID=UPI00221E4A90|nr:cytochrome c oxidase, subunit VIb [Halteromyces radiatus]KAI8096643.1 cytochrome c oxidase, subunit VIb [Halteromyces radiatus]